MRLGKDQTEKMYLCGVMYAFRSVFRQERKKALRYPLQDYTNPATLLQ